MRKDITSSTDRRPDEGRRPERASRADGPLLSRFPTDSGGGKQFRPIAQPGQPCHLSSPARRERSAEIPFSNRKIQELESHLTHRKQMIGPLSNRKFAIRRGSQSRASSPRRTSRGISLASAQRTRHCCRVESSAIHSKQRVGVPATCHCNRGRFAASRITGQQRWMFVGRGGTCSERSLGSRDVKPRARSASHCAASLAACTALAPASAELQITAVLIDTPAIRNGCNQLERNDGRTF
jgi:hypothetical protein